MVTTGTDGFNTKRFSDSGIVLRIVAILDSHNRFGLAPALIYFFPKSFTSVASYAPGMTSFAYLGAERWYP